MTPYERRALLSNLIGMASVLDVKMRQPRTTDNTMALLLHPAIRTLRVLLDDLEEAEKLLLQQQGLEARKP